MNAAHHLARQIIEGGDVELEHREGDADGVGQKAPAAGAEARREPVLEIVELDLDGPFAALSLQHLRRLPSTPKPATPYSTGAATG